MTIATDATAAFGAYGAAAAALEAGQVPVGPHGPIGVLVCGHGSRNRLAVEEFADLVGRLRLRLAGTPVEFGYLEFARPILRDGLEALRQQGVRHVLAIPAMLFAAGHVKNDIPSVLNTYAAESGLRIDYGRELGVDRGMILAAGARIQACLDSADRQDREAGRPPVARHDTLLVVVGRGASDPDANSNVAKVTRMLVEGFGFGWGETLYSGVTFPLVEPGLRQVLKLGYRRVVVFPYFLFSGVLVSRIVQHSQRVAADHGGVEILHASYLGAHPQVLATFEERVLDVLRGETAMNCSLCKYRAQVLGFEMEVGSPQHSHHHHVEGLVESCTLCERECTGACQPDGVPLPLGTAGAVAAGESITAGGHRHDHGHSHSHDHGHSHGHSHDDHHHGHSHSQVSSSQDQGHGPGDRDGLSPEPDHGHHQGQHHGSGHHPASDGHLISPSHGPDALSPSPSPGDETVAAGASPAPAGNAPGHHHTPYPHADHPLGPRTLRSGAGGPGGGTPGVGDGGGDQGGERG
jgi:sirohydrochlorin cobaltochelatase